MEAKQINIGDVVRHLHVMRGTDLSVIAVGDRTVTVRYASDGIFLKEQLFLHEVALFAVEEDEYS